jgi:hypothetical protein
MQVCIGLCVYNNEFGLPHVFKNIERIQTLFKEKIHIIIAYDESPDTSLGFIMSKLDAFDIHILKNEHKIKYPFKIGYICDARNLILNYIRNFFPYTHYLMMMDTNEYACIGDINLKTLIEALNMEKKWDSISFDREAGYYDYWALSFDPFIYSIFHTSNVELVVEQKKKMFTQIMEKSQQNSNEFIPVYSAFNGFAIYKWNIFKHCNYSYHIDISLFPSELLIKQVEMTKTPLLPLFENAYDCEHRHFHLQAIRDKNARIVIYPKSLFAKFTGEKKKDCRGPC